MEDNHENFYRTGSTTPPKGHSGLVAVLLVLVIILAGLVSILSLLNIRMFSAFYKAQQQEASVSLKLSQSPPESGLEDPEEPTAPSGQKSIGITGDAITPVYQQHFQLPEGLFIAHVEEGSAAWEQDIREGDVLISLNNIPITDQSSLERFLNQRSAGEACTAVIYRLEEEKQLSVILEIEETK